MPHLHYKIIKALTVLYNHNMGTRCFIASICYVRYAKLKKFFLWCLLWGHSIGLLNYANSTETESLGKNGCRQKCLDRRLPKDL